MLTELLTIGGLKVVYAVQVWGSNGLSTCDLNKVIETVGSEFEVHGHRFRWGDILDGDKWQLFVEIATPQFNLPSLSPLCHVVDVNDEHRAQLVEVYLSTLFSLNPELKHLRVSKVFAAFHRN